MILNVTHLLFGKQLVIQFMSDVAHRNKWNEMNVNWCDHITDRYDRQNKNVHRKKKQKKKKKYHNLCTRKIKCSIFHFPGTTWKMIFEFHIFNRRKISIATDNFIHERCQIGNTEHFYLKLVDVPSLASGNIDIVQLAPQPLFKLKTCKVFFSLEDLDEEGLTF